MKIGKGSTGGRRFAQVLHRVLHRLKIDLLIVFQQLSYMVPLFHRPYYYYYIYIDFRNVLEIVERPEFSKEV